MMFESLIRHPMRLLIGLVVLIVLLSQTLTIVPEDKQALVLRFGEIERMKNVYRPGERFGASGAGLLVRMPFIASVQKIDKRVLGIHMERPQVLFTDQQRLQVDAFARFRITNPRSEEHTSELQSLIRISYDVFCLENKKIFSTNNKSLYELTPNIQTPCR